MVAVSAEGESWAAVWRRTEDRAVRRPEGAAGPILSVDSRFLVYSVAKPMLAAAALRLAGRGRLGLDAPLSRHLPEAPNAERVTPRQLLSHRAGYPDYGGLAAYHDAVRRGDPPWTDRELLERTGASALLFEPGTGWAYSNIGYLLARRLLETVTGASLKEVLAAELFRPLGLSRTRVVETPEDLEGLAFGRSAYLGGEGAPVPVPGRYHPGWVTHGAVVSTAPEVARFLDALFGGELLSRERLSEMCELVPVADPDPDRPWTRPSYGLGLMADPASPRGGRVFGHTGAGPGSVGAAYRFPERSPPVTAVVLSAEEDEVRAEWTAFAAAAASGA